MRPSAKSVALIRVKNKEIGSVNEQNFVKIQCGKVKNYLWGKSIQLSDGGKEKKSRTIQLCNCCQFNCQKCSFNLEPTCSLFEVKNIAFFNSRK